MDYSKAEAKQALVKHRQVISRSFHPILEVEALCYDLILALAEGRFADAEAAAGVKLLWKIPNQYFAVSTAIDRGIPLMQQNDTDIARSFTGLAARLTENDADVKRTAWSLFKTV